MNFEPSQDSIVAQLNGRFQESGRPFSAQKIPDAENDYRKAATGVMAYVVNTDSNSPGVRNTNASTQDRFARFAVECFSRKLYGDDGLFAARHLVEKALVGFKPTSCDRLYFVRDAMDKGTDGIWIYLINFECKTMIVQDDLSDPVIVPRLAAVQSTFQNAGNSEDDGNGESTNVIP